MLDLNDIGAFTCRLGCALIAGGILGWEREVSEKPAGLRTNMIVSLGAAMLVLVGVQLVRSDLVGNATGAELTRIIQGIIGGIGFLGAGTIIQSRNDVRGLTTASTLWLSAGLGISSGLGYYGLTLVTVVMGVVVLRAFGLLESRLLPNNEAPSTRQ